MCPAGQVATAGGGCVAASACAVNNGGCDPNATCTDVDGAAQCRCNTGFAGDGNTCAAKIACGASFCDLNATCENGQCVCGTGYIGDGTICAVEPPGGIGATCSNMSPGDCAAGFSCEAVGSSFMCTQLGCTQDADCGSSGQIENVCFNGECYRGCDPLITDSCNRPDFGCSSVGGRNHCVAGCSGPDAVPCPYGTACNATSNVCEPVPCHGTGPGSCPSGGVCASVYGQQVCVPSCANDPTICPAGASCNSQGVCDGLSDVGATCADGLSGSQSNCENGFTCHALSNTTNACTLVGCQSDTDCGSNNGNPNACLPDAVTYQGLCWRGCDPATADSCGRPDLVCATIADPVTGSPVNVCQPDCRLQSGSYCAYGTECSNATGTCEANACSGQGQSTCQPGDVCASVQGFSVCVRDCRTGGATCPAGTACGGDGTCSAGAAIGASCLDSTQQAQSNCISGLTCTGQAGVNVCTESCESDTTCGSNGPVPNVCVTDPQSSSGTCYRGCSLTDPSSCGRPDLVCVQASNTTSGQPEAVCMADCRMQPTSFCSFGTVCDADSGQCKAELCPGPGQGGCATGQVCASIGGQSLCAPDCRSSGNSCPSGSRCGSDGLCNPGADVGQKCADSSQQAQSTCDATYICAPITAANYCSKPCAADADCGSNGSAANVCASLTSDSSNSQCLRGCKPGQPNACGRPDLTCTSVTNSIGQTENACIADCRQPGNECSYGSICNQTTGLCAQTPCTGLGQGTCGTGQVCANVNGSALCVTDCRQGGVVCPGGTQCDANGTCNAGADVGASCADSSMGAQSTCDAGYACISVQGVNMCTLPTCDPSSSGTCGTNGPYENICVEDPTTYQDTCYRGCDPSNPSSCGRPDLTCQSQTDSWSGSTQSYCVPDCRMQPASFCAYGTTCSMTNGTCTQQTCTGTGQSTCPTGNVCASVNGTSVCVPDCNLGTVTCPSGTSCDAHGTCSVGSAIGITCADSSQNAQSTCPAGYSCVANGNTSMCTILDCNSDSACGTSGAFSNMCLNDPTLGRNVCYRACSPAVPDSCGRSDQICGTQVDPSTGRGVNYCVPDCRTGGDAACVYGQVCESSGSCSAVACTGSGQGTCSTGELCVSVNGQTQCAADCRTAGVVCPSGSACDTGSGECTLGAGIGVTCTSPGGQSTCSLGYTCEAVKGADLCTTSTGCQVDSDCGTNGTIANVCFAGRCLRGCDPATSGSCGSASLICAGETDPFTSAMVNVCVGDCRAPGAPACDYGTSCDQGSGLCTAQTCTGTGQGTCASGDVCGAVDGQTVCVADCRSSATPCPASYTCDSSGICHPPTGAYYEQCTNGTTCNAGLSCVSDPSITTTLCLTNCVSDADCPTNLGKSVCVLDLPNGQTACGLTCDLTNPTCPTGTSCVDVDGFGDTYCVPM